MDRLQYLLTKLAEEGAEVAQIALKTQQFGLDERCASMQESNKERCWKELDDLNGIIQMLNDEFDFGYTPSQIAINNKVAKVNKYAAYSEQLGMLRKTGL